MPVAKLQKEGVTGSDKVTKHGRVEEGGERRRHRNDWGNLVRLRRELKKQLSVLSRNLTEIAGPVVLLCLLFFSSRRPSWGLALERGLPVAERCTMLGKTGRKGDHQTLEINKNHAKPSRGRPNVRSLWAKQPGGCPPRSRQRLWKNPKASVSGRPPAPGARIGAKWVPARSKATRGRCRRAGDF